MKKYVFGCKHKEQMMLCMFIMRNIRRVLPALKIIQCEDTLK